MLDQLADLPVLVQLAMFLGVWGIIWLPIAIPLAWKLGWHPSKPMTLGQKLPLVSTLYVLAIPLLLFVGKLDVRITGLSWQDYGILGDRSVILFSVVKGVAIGVFGLFGMFLILERLGWMTWQVSQASDTPDSSSSTRSVGAILQTLCLTLILGIWIGGTEELIFRGFMLVHLQQNFGVWMAGAIASLIFAVLHLIWNPLETLPQLPGLWLMGMVLALSRWVDGGLIGLAWGLHAGWVWGMSAIDSLQVITPTGRGMTWIVGKAGQPLAGLSGCLFLLVTAGFLCLL
jgi:membrane protease YdiL (CAAX protease family)